ncbi:hypothetical protein RFI_33857, partial [Reticulomyxa filosa]
MSVIVNGFVFIGRMNTRGGMQTKDTNNRSVDNNRYAKEIDLLMVIYSNITDENELRSKLEEFNGNISSVISYLASKNCSSSVKSTQIQLNYLFNKFENLIKITKEYYDEQKIIFDIISWKPNIVSNINNQQFQQQFEIYSQQFLINHKLLNEEVGIIQLIEDKIYDNNLIFVNLKSRLLRLIQSSKVHIAANIKTIINVAR